MYSLNFIRYYSLIVDSLYCMFRLIEKMGNGGIENSSPGQVGPPQDRRGQLQPKASQQNNIPNISTIKIHRSLYLKGNFTCSYKQFSIIFNTATEEQYTYMFMITFYDKRNQYNNHLSSFSKSISLKYKQRFEECIFVGNIIVQANITDPMCTNYINKHK